MVLYRQQTDGHRRQLLDNHAVQTWLDAGNWNPG